MMICGGQQVAGREHDQQQDVQLEAEPREHEPEHRRDPQDQDQGRDHDDQRVQEVVRQLGVVPGRDEVVELSVCGNET